MKKQLLYAFAFFGAITFASAQNSTVTYDTSGDDSQEFLVGNSKYIDDSGIVTITGGSATVATNANFFGILANSESPNAATGTFTFTVTTTSATPADLNLTFALAKRKGNNASGNVTIGGDTTNFSFPSDGTITQGVSNESLTFSETISVSSTTPATVIITLSTLEDGSVTSGHAATLRLTGITVNTISLDVEENLANEIVASISPNPVTNSFNVSSNDVQNISVYSINGQLVKSFTQSNSYDVSDLSTGIYSVKITTATGTKSIKIIKE